MSVKVKDMTHIRLSAPDLDRMEEFLVAFGLQTAVKTADRLYMRGQGAREFVHVTELGEPKLIGFGFEARSSEDLDALSLLPDASAVEAIDEPGGGSRVVLREPNGYAIEIVHGSAPRTVAPIDRQPINNAAEPLRRAGILMRPEEGPAHVQRIAHCVLGTPRVAETVGWFRSTLGLIASDDVMGDDGNLRMSFSRLDRGDDYVDHHVLFCAHNPNAGLNHVSFEVSDVDDLFMGHEHLTRMQKYQHVWGIGRHFLGSNIFNYWADPWGRVHEQWTDTDRLNAASGGNVHRLSDGVMRGIWGSGAPDSFKQHVTP
jgi:catechol 2,3-dioxygenase-like lactoylglutathione lyase family enzyme